MGVSANPYSVLSDRLVARLRAGLTTYANLVVERRQFRPDNLPTFTRYCIIVSPTEAPWAEQRTAVREVQDLLRLNIYVLVTNFDDTLAVFGTTAPNLGLFELVKDIKEVLRTETFDGLLDKTYDEAGGDPRTGGGPIHYGTMAVAGFDAGEHSFIYRARIPYLGRIQPHCHARAS